MFAIMIVEICCDSFEKALAAQQAGAGRIELCAELAVGGITPSETVIDRTLHTLSIPVHVLIRPRAGNFHYSKDEIEEMLESIRTVARLSAEARAAGRQSLRDGVVVGALDARGDVEVETCRRLIRTAREHGLSVTFHRAIDVARDLFQALRDILPLNVDRILTSGGALSAFEGREQIARMQQISRAENGPALMPGAGVNAENVGELLRKTGVSEVHGSRIEIIRAAVSAQFLQ